MSTKEQLARQASSIDPGANSAAAAAAERLPAADPDSFARHPQDAAPLAMGKRSCGWWVRMPGAGALPQSWQGGKRKCWPHSLGIDWLSV